jgi:hypothetical protein
MAIIVPPGGFVGFAQMTPASRASLTQGQPRTTRMRRKGGKKKRAAKRVSRRVSTKRGKKGRLIKGSAAAKRYMASIRKRRKK